MDDAAVSDILENLATGVLRIGQDDRVRYLNPAAADLLATSPRHARGRRLAELLPLDENLVVFMDRARRGGEPLSVAELELLCGAPPGQRRRVACDILPLDDGQLQVEIQALDRRQLVAEETGLWQNHQAQRLLFQALAHEVKNPLSGLKGAAQLLAAETTDPAQREYLDIMLRETDRLRDLVDGLLGPARAPRYSSVNIHEVLEHVHGLLQPSQADTLTWRRDYDPSLPPLDADADQLTQVFLNLVSNAIEAMRGNGRIGLRTRIERHYTSGGQQHRLAIRVDIEDDGPGVPEHLHGSLFLPLVTGRAEGTGLGLPIAQDIVQRHGGLIEWRSVPGDTVFSVILPSRRRPDATNGKNHD